MSFLTARLVIIGADLYPFFEEIMINNWLSLPGSGIFKILCIVSLGKQLIFLICVYGRTF